MNAPYLTLAQQQAVAKQIHDYFVGVGLRSVQACGIVAQPDAESSFRATVIGDNGKAFGLFQLHNDRAASLLAAGFDMKSPDVLTQCRGVWYELNHTEKRALAQLRAATDAYDAGVVMSMFYERPANAAAQADKRGMLAVKWYAVFNPETAAQ